MITAIAVSTVAIRDVVVPIETWEPQRHPSNDEFEYIDISSVDRHSKDIVSINHVRAHEAPSRARRLVRADDVLVSTVRPNLNAVAVVPTELDGATASTGFCVLRSNRNYLSSRYLFHWVRTQVFIKEMVRRSIGANYPAVSDRIILDSKLPHPPLSEQKRIAAILDKADAIRRKQLLAIEATCEIEWALFYDLFGDPTANNLGFDSARLDTLVRGIVDCPHSTPSWTEHGVVALRTSNLGRGAWVWDDTRFVDESQYRKRTRRSELHPGDVILSREGTVGIAAIVESGMRICMGQRLVQIKPDMKVMLSEYLLHVLLHELSPVRIERVMAGSTSKHLNVKELRNLLIPVPPLVLQRGFDETMFALRRMRNKFQHVVGDGGNLFNALVQRAFRGEL